MTTDLGAQNYNSSFNPTCIFLASLSPTNFFRIKKQNFKKNKLEKEEKLFRERFEVCFLKVKRQGTCIFKDNVYISYL